MSAMASQIASVTIVYSTIYSGADQRKYQSSASLAFVRGIHRSPVNSRHKRASNAENVSIWWRHHAIQWVLNITQIFSTVLQIALECEVLNVLCEFWVQGISPCFVTYTILFHIAPRRVMNLQYLVYGLENALLFRIQHDREEQKFHTICAYVFKYPRHEYLNILGIYVYLSALFIQCWILASWIILGQKWGWLTGYVPWI